MIRILVSLLFLCLPLPAAAAWKEARSKHFAVYSEGSEERLRKTIADLEKYFFMLHFMTGTKPRPNPTPVKVYIVQGTDEVAEVMGGGGAAGFYSATHRGPIAVTIAAATGGEFGLGAQEVLLHELAHHFMYQNAPAAYPSWYSEGFADYFGTAKIRAKDVIEVGHPMANRYLAFEANEWLPVRKLLTAKSYADVGGRVFLLYAQGWLLTHYLQQSKKRGGQLQRYLTALNAGKSYEAAAEESFGDIKALDDELRDYSGNRRVTVMSLPFKPIDVGTVTLRTLSPAEDALLPLEMKLGRGIYRKEAPRFAESVRNRARRFADDPYALKLLVEAERAAGDQQAARAAVAQWRKVAPNDPLAMMHEAELAIDALVAAKSSDEETWDAARETLLAANKLAPRNPEILLAYYSSYRRQNVLPPPAAQNALVRAFEIVPQADQLRHMVATDYEARGMIEEAIHTIKPAAYQLHAETDAKKKERAEKEREKWREVGDARSETALEMLTRLEKSRGALAAN